MQVEIRKRGEYPDEQTAKVIAVVRPELPRTHGRRSFYAGRLTYHYRDGWHADAELRRTLECSAQDGANLREWRKALAEATVRPCPPHSWAEFFVPGGVTGRTCSRCHAEEITGRDHGHPILTF